MDIKVLHKEIEVNQKHRVTGAKPQRRKHAYVTHQVLGELSSKDQEMVLLDHIHLQ